MDNSQALPGKAPQADPVPGIELAAPAFSGQAELLTPAALDFLAELHRRFEATRQARLIARRVRAARFDAGELPDFRQDTRVLREANWQVAELPRALLDRRVEITGPVEPKMVINALNSRAQVYMADFEDSTTPTWANLLTGQRALRKAVAGTLDWMAPDGSKHYVLKSEGLAVLMVRPRGWHLNEKHVLVDGEVMSGSLFDFGLYFFLNAKELLARGSGPYFYLPKLESHLEARLWNEVFVATQELLGVAQGSVRATVLIETILAAFEMDEILYELRDHSAGLNCGRWDYIFSCIKKFRNQGDFVLADRALVTMTTHFMRSYSLLCIKTCHRRAIHAMGGMAAQIPIKSDPAANEAALSKVRVDKEREANDGHDGTWVAHPGLVPIAYEAFDAVLGERPNQISKQRDDVKVSAGDLLNFGPEGPITEQGLRMNINIGVQYLGAWLAGNGCVPIFNLMEDAATAEISRAQLWQWINSAKGVLDDGRKVDVALFRQLLPEELERIKQMLGVNYDGGHYEEAADLFDQLTTSPQFEEFLTLSAYDRVD